MYLVGDTILCIQDHPEYDAGYITGLVETRRARMGDAITDEALAADRHDRRRQRRDRRLVWPTSCSIAGS